MSVVIRIRRQKAFLRDGEWRCASLEIERELNELQQQWIVETGGPPLASRDPEAVAAREIARRSGARVILHIPADRRNSARTYFARRQLKLAFGA